MTSEFTVLKKKKKSIDKNTSSTAVTVNFYGGNLKKQY